MRTGLIFVLLGLTAAPLAAVRTGIEMQQYLGKLMQDRNARGVPVYLCCNSAVLRNQQNP